MPTLVGDGCFTKQDIDTLNTALANSGLGGGAITVTTLVASSTSDLQGAVTCDSTLAVTGAATFANTVAVTGVFSALVGAQSLSLTAITASGAIDSHTAANYIITKSGVAAMTLAAPTATTDDGKLMWVASSTAFAHTVTATGLFQDGGTTVNLATFAAHAGAGMLLMAYQAKWIVLIANAGITMS